MHITQVAGLPVGKSSLVPKAPGKRKGKTKGTWTETPGKRRRAGDRPGQEMVLFEVLTGPEPAAEAAE